MRGLLVFALGTFLAQGVIFSQGIIFEETFENWESTPPCPLGWECSTTSNCLPTAFCFWNRQDQFVAIGLPDTLDCDNSGNYARCNTTQLQFGQVLTMESPLIDLSATPPTDSLILDFCYINGSLIEIDEDGIRVSFSPDSGLTWTQQFEDNSRNFSNWELIRLPIEDSFYTSGFQVKFEGFSGNSTGDLGIDGLIISNSSTNCGIDSFDINVSGNTLVCSDQQADSLFLPELDPGQGGIQWIYTVTDEQDSLLQLTNEGFIDFNTFMPGSYKIRGVKYVGPLDAPLGSHISEWNATPCFVLSNNTIRITVNVLDINTEITSPYDMGVSCVGAQDANIQVNVTQGLSPYIYSWSNGENNASLTNVGAGTYTVEVRDQNQCLALDTVTVLEPEKLQANILVESDFNGQAISCNGAEDGRLRVEARGGSAPYNFLWSNGMNTDTISGLGPRQYVVFVGDAFGCVALDSVTLQEPEGLEITAEVISDYNGEDISGPDAQDGQVMANVEGGTPPYTFRWNTDPVQNSQVASGLGAGIYTVAVIDGNSCVDSTEVLVRSPGTFTARLSIISDYSGQAISCFGAEDAELAVRPIGGVPPYRIEWANLPEFSGQDTLSGLGPGNYEVSIRDAEDTEVRASIDIQSPSAIDLSFDIIPPPCNEQETGQILVRPSGGTPAYTFLWSDGNQDAIRTNLGPGIYQVTIEDQNSCTLRDSVTLEVGEVLFATYSVVNEGCEGIQNGSIRVNPENGLPPYTYIWSTGQQTQEISGLGTGLYAIELIDSLGCSRKDTIEVGLADSLEVTLQISDDPGDGTGSAQAEVSGGTPPYRYNWSHSELDSTNEVSNLVPGDYVLEVSDAASCSVLEIFEIMGTGEPCPPIHLGFTPNGDGVNDQWSIPCIEDFENNTVSIIGRWGQTLIQFSNYNNSWNGEVKGKPLPPGSYYFLIQSQSSTRVFKGTLTLIR